MPASDSEKRSVNRKERMQLEKVDLRYRPVEERVKDFEEAAQGFTAAEAMAEAARCIHCPEPAACVVACPLGNDIERALWSVEAGDFIEAARIYRETNPWPEICGRVCPDEASCATKCVLTKRGKGINTQAIESFVADYQREHEGIPLPEKAPPTGQRVCIVGAGPAGLAAAEDLAVAGHEVTVYDAWPAPGGLLVYGIPNFKLAKGLVRWKTDWLRDLGVNMVMSTRIGETITLDDLVEKEGYDAVFLGTGAGVEARMEVPGENLGRVYGSMQYLVQPGNVPTDLLPEEKRQPIQVGRRVAVIGGGDTATDCMRTALRQGAEKVVCYYRRTEAEMPGNAHERHHAEEEGAEILYLTAPVEMLDKDGDGNVDAMRMILAVGFWPDPLLGKTTPELETHKWGLIVVDPETGQTSRPEIFAGGDDVTGPSLVNAALAAGKRAAKAMVEYLAEKKAAS